jgi:hypothetical protein
MYFHRHGDYLYLGSLKMLELIRFITYEYKFSFLDSLKVLCTNLMNSKLKYASVVWNNLTLADSYKLENIQRKFAD